MHAYALLYPFVVVAQSNDFTIKPTYYFHFVYFEINIIFKLITIKVLIKYYNL